MQICTRCIIPDTFPNVTFEGGVCSFCRNHDRLPKINDRILGEAKLKELTALRGKSEYDVAVPLSGGKDSSYVLYYVVKKLGLRPLALCFDNGFINKVATRNVRKLCDSLGAGLILGEATPHRAKLVGEALKTSQYLGKFTRVCGNCENNLRSFAINQAKQHSIPLIIWGSTDFEDSAEFFLSKEPITHRKRFGKLSNIKLRIKKALGTLFQGKVKFSDTLMASYHGLKCLYHGVRDNIAQKTPEGVKVLNPFLEVSLEGKGVRSISLFDYIAYNPYQMIETLKQEIGWEAPSDKEARMDCRIHAISNYKHYINTGITKDGFTLTVLVRNGLLSREDALRKEQAMRNGLDAECREIMQQYNVAIDVKPL